jgi:hypothetical protein
MTVAGAVATGVGVLGWITFLGGALLWIRADQAHLPATEAVAVTPRPVLVTEGAELAALAAGLGLLAVAAIFVWDAVMKERNNATAGEVAGQLARLDRKIANRHQLVAAGNKAALAIEGAASKLEADGDTEGASLNRIRAEQARTQTSQARDELEVLERDRAAQQGEVNRVQRRDRLYGGIPLAVLLLAPQVWIAVSKLSSLDVLWAILVAALGIGLSFVVFVNQKPIWFGLAAFIAITIFVGFETYLRTSEHPKVEPAAALRLGAGPLCGFFVAQTSDYLYMGTYARPVAIGTSASQSFAGSCTGPSADAGSGVKTSGLPPRLITVPNDEVTDLAVGQLQSLRGGIAAKRSAVMALDLCERRATSGQSTSAKAKKLGCSDSDLEQLRALIRKGPATSGG